MGVRDRAGARRVWTSGTEAIRLEKARSGSGPGMGTRKLRDRGSDRREGFSVRHLKELSWVRSCSLPGAGCV